MLKSIRVYVAVRIRYAIVAFVADAHCKYPHTVSGIRILEKTGIRYPYT